MLRKFSVTFGLFCTFGIGAAQPAGDPFVTLPPETQSLGMDYAHDLMALFSWALDIRFTEAEQKRFIRERQLEWVSGHYIWQCQFVGTYWSLLACTPEIIQQNKSKVKETILDFVQYNAKTGVEDVLWIQKRLGDDEVETLPKSKGRRSKFESMGTLPKVSSMMVPSYLGGQMESNLEYLSVSNLQDALGSMLLVPLMPDQRDELFARATKHWKQNPDEWGGVAFKKTLFSYFNSSADKAVYKNNSEHNVKVVRSYIERGDRDSKWIIGILEGSRSMQSIRAGTPELTINLTRDYSRFLMEVVNDLYGKKVVTPDTKITIGIQQELAKNWETFDPEKRKFILEGSTNLTTYFQYYPLCIPLKREHLKYVWGKQMMKSMPALKPLIEARGNEFAQLAKKNPKWLEDMEASNNEALQLYMAQKQKEYNRFLDNMKTIFDSQVWDAKMRSLSDTISRAPSGTTIHVTIRP